LFNSLLAETGINSGPRRNSGMQDSPYNTADAARDAFLEVYARDLQAGSLRELDDYQQLFPGYEEAIAAEWSSLEPVGQGRAAGDGAVAERPPGLREIGPYRLLEELGRGAQAVVHLAEHRELRRRVALKILRGPLFEDTEAARVRFRHEAEATAGIEHPSICSVYETGHSDGMTWIAMQYVPGETLAARLKARGRDGDPVVALPDTTSSDSTSGSGGLRGRSSGRGEAMRLAAFVEQAARALHAAHECGLVHRDVKPGNLMVAADGRPVVLDFGLARHQASADLGLTRSTDVLGTPYYMAPEQLQRSAGVVDRRADVWALGVTLYECLTGHRPFEAETRERLYREILDTEPTAPRTRNPRLPRDLEVVMLTALEKEPDRRFQTALDFAEDLRRVQESQPITARPVSPAGRLLRWARRHPAIAGSLSVAVLALVAGVVVSLVALGEARQALTLERAVRSSWYDDLSRAVAFEDTHGRSSLLQGKVREQALGVIDEQAPGFRERIEAVVMDGTPVDQIGDRRRYGELLRAVQGDLDELGRLCAADLLHGWARSLLSLLGEPAYFESAITLAAESLEATGELPSTDVRVVRARVLLLDALLARGNPDDVGEARRLADGWLSAERAAPQGGGELREALYATRLGGALLAAGELPDAETLLGSSVDRVVRSFPHSFYANGALAHLAVLQDRSGSSSVDAGPGGSARARLNDSIAATVDIPFTNPHCGWAEVRAAVGPARSDLWQWIVEVRDRSRVPLQESDVDDLLVRLSALREAHGIEDGDAILHQVARVLSIAANNQMNTSNGRPRRIGKLYETAAALLATREGRGDSYYAVAFTLGPLGDHYSRRGRWEPAIASFRAAMEACPEDSYVRSFLGGGLGMCLTAQGDFEQAELLLRDSAEVLREWRGRTDGNVWVRIRWLVDLYRAWGRLGDAVSWHRQEIEDWGGVDFPHSALAETYLRFGEADRCIETIEAAGLGDDPGSSRTLAQAWLLRGDTDTALRWSADQVAAGEEWAHFIWARALLRQGDAEAALPHFEAAVEVGVVAMLLQHGFWSDYATAVLQVQGPDAARKLLREVTDRYPRGRRAWFERAHFLTRSPQIGAEEGVPESALSCAEQACALDRPGRPHLLAVLARAQSLAGDRAAARSTADRALEQMEGRDAEWLRFDEMRALRDELHR
jgi:serine/threonine protein kinase/tetratricopeptide (TPR) repeat protein